MDLRLSMLITVMLLFYYPLYANAITLQEAMDGAATKHPILKISQAQITAVQGELREQSAYAYNPEISFEPQRRKINGGGSSSDYYITLSQGIELGGKQGYREQSARAALEVRQFEADAQQQKIVINAARSLVAVYFSKQELLWREQQLATLLQLSNAMQRQLEVGEANQLDVNLAQASLTQAINAESQTKQQHIMNVSQYLIAVGDTGKVKEIAVELPQIDQIASMQANNALPDLVTTALQSRLDIAAKQRLVSRYVSQTDIAKSNKVPDITISLMAGRETGDQLYSLALTVPIPLLNNHDGAYRAALAQTLAQQNALQWWQRQVKLEVQAAIYNHTTAMRAVSTIKQFKKTVASTDYIKLAKAAFDAGELDIEELVVHINQILEARINSAAIRQQAWLARIRLAEVLGHPEYILEGKK